MGNSRTEEQSLTARNASRSYYLKHWFIDTHRGSYTDQHYYQALMARQQYRNTEKEVIGDWMVFFLDCLHSLTVRLKSKYALYKKNGGYLNERQRLVLAILQKQQPAKLNDLKNNLQDVSVNTLKKDLQYLVQQSRAERIGQSKATVYIIKTPLSGKNYTLIS